MSKVLVEKDARIAKLKQIITQQRDQVLSISHTNMRLEASIDRKVRTHSNTGILRRIIIFGGLRTNLTRESTKPWRS